MYTNTNIYTFGFSEGNNTETYGQLKSLIYNQVVKIIRSIQSQVGDQDRSRFDCLLNSWYS